MKLADPPTTTQPMYIVMYLQIVERPKKKVFTKEKRNKKEMVDLK